MEEPFREFIYLDYYTKICDILCCFAHFAVIDYRTVQISENRFMTRRNYSLQFRLVNKQNCFAPPRQRVPGTALLEQPECYLFDLQGLLSVVVHDDRYAS